MAFQAVYLVLWLLNFHCVTGLRHIEDADLEKIEVEENHSTTAAFQFSVINNSSLPLNFLALPKLAQIYAHTKNRVIPGEKFAFLAALGAYDLHVTVQDGRNDWYQVRVEDKITHHRSLTASLPFTPEKCGLEDKPFLLGFGNFSGVNSLLNFGRVTFSVQDDLF